MQIHTQCMYTLCNYKHQCLQKFTNVQKLNTIYYFFPYHSRNGDVETRDIEHQKSKVGQGKKENEEPSNALEGMPGAAPPISTRQPRLFRMGGSRNKCLGTRHSGARRRRHLSLPLAKIEQRKKKSNKSLYENHL